MSKAEASRESSVDVVVLGNHPADYFVSALLKHKSKLQILHATIPGLDVIDRLVSINPKLFDLHPMLSSMQPGLKLTDIFGIRFLADDPAIHSEHRSTTAVTCVGRFKVILDSFAELARAEEVELIAPKAIQIHRLDEEGIDLTIGKRAIRAKALVLGDTLPPDQMALLGLSKGWGREIVHRFTFVRCKTAKHAGLGDAPVMPMSLDLHGKLNWAWFLPGDGEFQLQVEQRIDAAMNSDCAAVLERWSNVLKFHRVLDSNFTFGAQAVNSIDLPLAGALDNEGVANRTLLVGPAGGFYSACGEDIYPNCWSAIFAADVLKKALKEPHLQDALNPYRMKWRTTLGNYLRGPQQNLRFLLPLVYRNPAMTDRLAEAILFSKSVVR